jgi:hypothetical protein
MNNLVEYESIPLEKLRDRLIDELVRQYSQENVDMTEFEHRTEIVSKAATRKELVAQVADLPDLAEESRGHGKPSAKARGKAAWRVESGVARAEDYALAIFGGSELKGVWHVPRKLSSLSVFGGTNIDLRKAIVPEGGVAIQCLCVFGGTDIIVPSGMRVHVRGAGIFGGFERTDNEPDDPDAPTIEIEGLAFFGGVSIRVRD